MISASPSNSTSRPLRGLALVLLCYCTGRAALVWLPSTPPVSVSEPQVAQASTRPFRSDKGVLRPAKQGARVRITKFSPTNRSSSTSSFRPTVVVSSKNEIGLVGTRRVGWTPLASATLSTGDVPTPLLLVLPTSPPAPVTTYHTVPARWSGSFYALTRGSGRSGVAPTLGATQAGVRLYRKLGASVAATASIAASPTAGGSREATIGVALRRGSAGVIAEHGLAIGDGGLRGYRLVGFAGFAKPLAQGFALDGYGQAGITPLGPFADGSVSVERSVSRADGMQISAGFSSWASVQRGARRLDIGPQLVARVPIGKQRVRVSAEWRARIAGNAQPSSGPSVTLGADF